MNALIVAVMLALLGEMPMAGAASASGLATNQARFESMACPSDLFPAGSRVNCGFVTVPENRAIPNGRTIRVAAAVMHASARHPAADPIVFLDGGPSFGAINGFAVYAYFGGASYAEDHDVVLVDTRGTGLSQPRLGCPEFDAASVAAFNSKPFVNSGAFAIYSSALTACRDRLSASGIDLTAYNTAESAADLEALRTALGYRTWNLVAFSADGVLGLTYMRLFPGGVRSAIIDSGQSAQHLPGLDYARGLNEELEAIFAGCAVNAGCNASYPHMHDVYHDLVDRLQAHPVMISVPDFLPAPVSLRLDGVGFHLDATNEIFPGNEFAPDSIRPLLSEIWRSAHGELAAVYRERFGSGPVMNDDDSVLARGKTMSYVCHDLVGFITRGDLRKAALDVPALAPIFLDPTYDLADGDTNVESPAGCLLWNVGIANPVQHQPVASAIPTLVLAGEYDTGVPPFIAQQIPGTLPNSFFYEFPAGAHGQLASYNTDSECARSIASQFLRDPRERPDATCIAALAPFDFTP
jgi:pimeloyl-ACP methyl ester carboxylesterase